jgi:hypothetical protein
MCAPRFANSDQEYIYSTHKSQQIFGLLGEVGVIVLLSRHDLQNHDAEAEHI